MSADERTYAGLVSRGMAFVVDAAIVVTLAIGLIAGAEVVGSAIGASARGLSRTLTPALVAAPPLLFVAYDTVCWSLTGRTAGMALFGVRVIRTRERPMTWGRGIRPGTQPGAVPVRSSVEPGRFASSGSPRQVGGNRRHLRSGASVWITCGG